MKIFFLVSFLFFCVVCQNRAIAQDKAIVLVQNMKAGGGITVKWYSASIINYDSVDVYRSEGSSSDWQKVNTKPIHILRGSDYIRTKDSSVIKIEKPLQTIKPYELDTTLMLYQVFLWSIYNLDFSKNIGIVYEDRTVKAGTAYRYSVRHTVSNKSIGTSKLITAGAWQPEDAPTGIELKTENDVVKFVWKDEPARMLGVNFYRKKNGESYKRITKSPVVIASGEDKDGNAKLPSFFFSDDSLKYGNTYTYKLAGMDLFGNETQMSGEYTADVKDMRLPPMPMNFAVSIIPSTHKARLTWTSNKNSKIKGINIYHSKVIDTGFEKVNTTLISSGASSYVYDIKEFGPQYFYIANVSKNGVENKADILSAPLYDDDPPAVPTDIVATSQPGAVKLTWTPGKEKDLLGYNVYRSIEKKVMEFNLITAPPIKSVPFIDSLPVNAKNTFVYRIKAVDVSGNKSEFSELIKVRLPDVTPPQAPTIIACTAVKNVIAVKWLPSLDKDLAGYLVFRQLSKDNASLKEIAKVSRNTVAVSDSAGTDFSKKYTYTVKAFDSAGNNSASSNAYRVSTLSDKDIATETFSVTATADTAFAAATLSWVYTPKEDFMGYTVFRSRGTERFLPISGNIPGTTFTDSKIKKGTKYSYKVVAYYTTGNKVTSQVSAIE